MRASFLGPLLSALAHTLMFIGFGAVLRSWRVLDDAELGGLSKFCAWLSLPCALFASVVDLHWSDVDWTLLLGIFVSKAIVFAGVSAVGLLHSRTPEAVARAGLFSILVTKSNDIAFALPIVAAIFPPAYVQLVYLFVPLQLAIINPIGLAMMEWGCAARAKEGAGKDGGGRLLVVILSTLTSPVMLAVGAGLVVNLTLRGRLPQPVAEFIEIGAQAYTATALLIVGAGLSVCSGGGGAAEQRPIDGVSALVGASLVFVKVFVASLVMYHVVGAMTGYDSDAVSFALVYGCMPPAPTVFVWARQYGVAELMVSRLLIVSLLVSAAFIVVTGLMMDMGASAARDDRGSMHRRIEEATLSASALTLGGAAWMAGVFVGCAQMRSGLRADLAPLALCIAASAALSIAHYRLAAESAARLPVDAARQLAHHLAVTYAACFAVRLLRSLRAPPDRMVAERIWYHAACVLIATSVTTAQLADREPPPRATDDHPHAFGWLGARAPRARIALYVTSLFLTVVPLVLFNARYVRVELRQHGQTGGARAREEGATWADWAPGSKWVVGLVRTGGAGGRGAFVSPPVLLQGAQPSDPTPLLAAASSAEPASGQRADAPARTLLECGDLMTVGALLAEVRALVPGSLCRQRSPRARQPRAASLLSEHEWDTALATAGITSAASRGGGAPGGAGLDVGVQLAQDARGDEGSGESGDEDAADAWVELRITRRRAPRRAQATTSAASEEIARAAAESAAADAPLVLPLITPSAALLHGEHERVAHAELLNELLGDSVRHLSWLAMSLVGMTLALSAALQDAAGARRIVLQEEITLLHDLAFYGQAIVMTACFALHPEVVAALRRLWRRTRSRQIEQRLRSGSRATIWQEVNEMRARW